MAPTTAPRMPITLRSVVPVISQEPREHAHLEEDLTKLRCIGLISKPWTVKDEKMVWEILMGVPNQYDITVCGQPETWSVEKWREACGFDARGEGFASKSDKFIGGKFWNPVNSKDGLAVVDCKDVRAKRVLEFLIPILYLEKPTRVTMTVGNTIFRALLGEQKVDWGVILQSVVAKLVKNVRKQKAMPIGPYLFHLYTGHECCFHKRWWPMTLAWTC